jgi:hypothetical protein
MGEALTGDGEMDKG